MWTNPQETKNLVPFTGEIVNGKLHFCVMDGGHWNIEEDWLQILSSRLSFTFFSPWNWKHTQKQVKIQQKRHPVELFRYCYKIFFNYLNKLPKRHTQHLLGACLNRRMLFLGGFSNLESLTEFRLCSRSEIKIPSVKSTIHLHKTSVSKTC